MFDRHGDILRCEQLDGPKTEDGDVLIVVEERQKRDWGPGDATGPAGGAPPRRPTQPGGDHIDPEPERFANDTAYEVEEQKEPLVVA